jgi:hypothetical protein
MGAVCCTDERFDLRLDDVGQQTFVITPAQAPHRRATTARHGLSQLETNCAMFVTGSPQMSRQQPESSGAVIVIGVGHRQIPPFEPSGRAENRVSSADRLGGHRIKTLENKFDRKACRPPPLGVSSNLGFDLRPDHYHHGGKPGAQSIMDRIVEEALTERTDCGQLLEAPETAAYAGCQHHQRVVVHDG